MGVPGIGSRRVEGADRQGALKPARGVTASGLFFPLAAAYAALILPASVLPMLGIAPALAGLASPAAHAHEMLFGFALLVVAGHQLGSASGRRIALVVALWAAARLSFLLAPSSLVAAGTNVAFATLLGTQLAPRLFAAAKKPRNFALPVVLTLLAGCAALTDLARAFGAPAIERTVLTVAVAAFSLLMLFMGGRLVAPAAAGHFHRLGANLAARVQPRIEGTLIALLLVGIAAAAFPGPRAVTATGAAALVAGGVLALARLARWRLWAARGRPDLACIGIGYAWVAVGLVAWGGSILAGVHGFAMLHAITVGGLGTLTFNVMALTRARVVGADPAASAIPAWGTALLAFATLARIAADFTPASRAMLLAGAAIGWSSAFLLLIARLAALAARSARRSNPEESPRAPLE